MSLLAWRKGDSAGEVVIVRTALGCFGHLNSAKLAAGERVCYYFVQGCLHFDNQQHQMVCLRRVAFAVLSTSFTSTVLYVRL